MIHAALIASLILAPPGDTFCDGLDRVIAAAPGKFAALDGRESEEEVAILDTEVQLAPGTLRCVIRDRSGGLSTALIYECVAREEEAADPEALEALGRRVGRCLGSPMTAYRVPEKLAPSIDIGYAATVPGATIDVSYGTMMHVRMTGTGPTLYELRLSVVPNAGEQR